MALVRDRCIRYWICAGYLFSEMTEMKRESLILESWRFTSTSALAREVVALLETSDYKLVIEVSPSEKEMLDNELENVVRALARVKVEVVA